MDVKDFDNFSFFLSAFVLGVITIFLLFLNAFILFGISIDPYLRVLTFFCNSWQIDFSCLGKVFIYIFSIVAIIFLFVVGVYIYFSSDLVLWIIVSKDLNLSKFSPLSLIKQMREGKFTYEVEYQIQLKDFFELKDENLWLKESQKYFKSSILLGGLFVSNGSILLLLSFLLSKIKIMILLMVYYIFLFFLVRAILCLEVIIVENHADQTTFCSKRDLVRYFCLELMLLVMMLVVTMFILFSRDSHLFFLGLNLILSAITLILAVYVREKANEYLILAVETNRYHRYRRNLD